jgi:hypothetical protein
MTPDFSCIRRETDKLHPSFPAALDRAFELMKQYCLEDGGDKHHGLMRSIWPKYKDLKENSWNMVRLPRQIHVRVHVLMAAAFEDTEWFAKFNGARMIAHAAIGSKFDSPTWQKRIEAFTKDGAFHVTKCGKQYGASQSALFVYAGRRNIRVANASEARAGFSIRSKFDSVLWQKRIRTFTLEGVFQAYKCAEKHGVYLSSLGRYAKNREIRVSYGPSIRRRRLV